MNRRHLEILENGWANSLYEFRKESKDEILDFKGLDFTTFKERDFKNRDHYYSLKIKRFSFKEAYFEEFDFYGLIFIDSDLSNAKFKDCDFSKCSFSHCDFTDSK